MCLNVKTHKYEVGINMPLCIAFCSDFAFSVFVTFTFTYSCACLHRSTFDNWERRNRSNRYLILWQLYYHFYWFLRILRFYCLTEADGKPIRILLYRLWTRVLKIVRSIGCVPRYVNIYIYKCKYAIGIYIIVFNNV